MRKLLAVVLVLVVCVVGFGFYRGWFALSSPDPAGGSNEVNINLATDPDKMKEDAEAVKDKAAELTGNNGQGDAGPADRPTDEVQPNPAPPYDGQP